MGAGVQPITFTGQKQEEDQIVRDSATGKDANSEINPSEVEKAVKDAENTIIVKVGEITKELNRIASEENSNSSLAVEGTNMSGTIQGIGQDILGINGQVKGTFDDIVTAAQKAHDIIQTNNNIEAYDSLASRGMTVTPSRPTPLA